MPVIAMVDAETTASTVFDSAKAVLFPLAGFALIVVYPIVFALPVLRLPGAWRPRPEHVFALRFFAAWAASVLGLRLLDLCAFQVAGAAGEPLLQPLWSATLTRWPWLVGHAGFFGLVGVVSFVLTCLGFSYLDITRNMETKIQKQWFPSVGDMVRTGLPQVSIYIVGNALGYVFGYHHLNLPLEAPRLAVLLEQVLMCFIVGDFNIYWEHRIMHEVPFLRKNIHSWHHAYKCPFSWAGGIVHPMEDAMVLVCQLSWPFLMGYHPLSYWIFFFLWVIFLVEEHSGHDVRWAPYNWMPFTRAPMGGGSSPHDIHHYKVTRNFGFVFCVWDHIFGTFEPVVELGPEGPAYAQKRQKSKAHDE